MNTAKGPVQRPVLTSVIFLIIIILGLVSLSRLSIDLMPEITYPTISVVTNYGNVGPQEMEELVTRPIEEALAAVPGVEEITSTSAEGRSMVRVAFGWGTDLDVAANDIRDRIDRALGRLPEDIERPMIRKFDLSAFPILITGVSSSMNPLDLRQLVEDQVKYRLERVPGVAAVDIWGGLMREIHIDLRAAQLKALGLSTENILAALRNENRNIPAGLYEKGNSEVLVRTQGEFSSLEEIENTVVTMRQGTPIQIRDVADVVDSWEEVRQLVRIDGKPGVRISVSKQSGANTVTVADAVNAEIVNDEDPMTYAFYHEVKRGTTPQSAPTYSKVEEERQKVKYRCTICNYIYDPEKGDPNSGVKPGTPFENLPEDWVCPICGATKDQFEKAE